MSAPRRVLVGSRTSPLSRVQTEEILTPLRKLHPDVTFEVVPITTRGDRDKSAPLLSMGRGMFVKEIESRLLSGDIDFAVHSAKDVPALLPEGLELAAFGPGRRSVAGRGEVTIATSTGGASPALARKFREELTGSRLLEYADLAPLLADARTELKGMNVRIPPDHWQSCITESLLNMVQAGDTELAKKTLMAQLLEGAKVAAAGD